MTIKGKLTVFFAVLLGLVTVLPVLAVGNVPRMYTPIDGVPIRQGTHIEWFRSGEMRFDAGQEEAAFVWSDTRSGYRGVYMQIIRKDGTFAFGEGGLKVVDAYGRQEDPQCWPCSDGGWFISWEDFAIDSLGDIYCTKVDKDGNILWHGNPADDATDDHLVEVCKYAKIQEDVRIADDLQGGCIIAWRDLRSGDQGDLYAMHIRGDGTPDPAWPLNGKAIVTAPGAQSSHTADRDDAGGMIIAWKDGRIDKNADIWAQRVTASGELMWGGGEGIVVCGEASNQSTPKLCPDGFGGAFISWQDERNFDNTHRDIYVQRVNDKGIALWTKDGEPVCDAAAEQLNNRIISSAAGEAIIQWDDKRNAPVGLDIQDIYAMRISGTQGMTKEWGAAFPQGVPVCTNAANQANARLIKDGQGGAFFVWEDERDGGFPELDLWGQRLNTNGTPVWTADGVPFVKLAGLQLSPIIRLLNDGTGAVVWGDYRSGSISLYAQRLDPNTGAGLYEENGRMIVAGLDGNAEDPLILPDGKGKAAIVYLDGRQGGRGRVPYIQKVEDKNDHADILFPIQGSPAMILEQAGGAVVPDAAMDAEGNIFTVWEDQRPGQTYAIYAQKISPTGEIKWGSMGTRVADYLFESSEQKNPKVIVDGTGGIIVFFKGSTEATYQNLFAQRLDADGNRLWGDKGARITNHEIDDEIEAMIADQHNPGAALVWRSNSMDTDWDLYMSRIKLDGTLDANFNKNGEGALPLCVYDGPQENAQIENHPDGYAIVWVDGRDVEAEQTDIYGQVVSATGEIQWTQTPLGWQICGEEHRQLNPSMTIDLDGNIWVVWEDQRMSDRPNKVDLYMQKLKPVVLSREGEFFARDGIALCNATNPQLAPNILHDGQNGIWAVWEDYRNGLWSDIYGVHLKSDGGLAAEYYVENGAWGIPVTSAFHKQEKPRLALINSNGFDGTFCVWKDKRSTGKEELSAIYLQRMWDGRTSTPAEGQNVALGYELESAYPNPFNSSTIIAFSLPRDGNVNISLFDVSGRLVNELTSDYWSAGTHRVVVDGSSLAAGTYLVKMTSGSAQLTRTIQLLK